MKAVVIRNPGRGVEAYALADRKEPVPGPREVLVRVRAASLNYRDLMVAKNQYGAPPTQDLVPLSDGAGEVVSLGANVTRWKVGDRVASTYYPGWSAGPMRPELALHSGGAGATEGVLSELALFPEDGVVRIPAHLSFEEASTLPCAAVTAWSALMEPAPRWAPGATVLVLGTGGVSIFAAQLALAANLRVIATTSSDAKAARLRDLGVQDVVNYRTTPEWQSEVLRLTGDVGADHVLEVGGAGTLSRSFEAVRRGGVISLLGVLTGVGQGVDPMPVLFKAIRLEGLTVGSVASFESLNRAVEAVHLKPVIDEVFPMARAADALSRLASGAHFGKIVVRVD
jgi:NADPH:quinone reductase-like Zn-dependent oxidoreductase